MWDNLDVYLSATENDSTHFQTLNEAVKDPLTFPRLHFFPSVASAFTPFLTRYQTDRPLIMFLYADLKALFKDILKRFVKSDDIPTSATGLTSYYFITCSSWTRWSYF
ncbi:hypothetical protein CAPTEDRAFT_209160 [Capitella teleta]|uniref:Uncharacterized protein n=1 Tax=Capitella teleta TaxID=283909 RepID=R7VBU1_CAPTE|nr:hypothetical protein CAPTEDRAFT_209160 [Capitella teleta]|eukprot:ELU13766.1 hypothetical protein CAPTEDRAFT_209160 [Capitella teleta]